MIARVHMIILMEPDVEAAVAFFKQYGAGITLKFHLRKSWAELDLAGVKIGICPTSQQVDLHRTGIVLQVTDLMAFYEAHKEAGIFLGEPITKPHGIMVSLKTPGGNVIDIYEPTPESLRDLVKNIKAQDSTGCCRDDKNEAVPVVRCHEDADEQKAASRTCCAKRASSGTSRVCDA